MAEGPVAGESRIAEQRQHKDKELICEGQVPYVVVGYRLGAHFGEVRDDVYDQTVAEQPEQEGGHVGDEDDVFEVAVVQTH